MTLSRILEITVFFLVLFAVQIPLRKRELPAARVIVFIFKLILIPAAALLFVAIESAFNYRRGDLFAAAYVVLFGDAAASAAEYVVRRLRARRDRRAGRRPCLLILLGALGAGGWMLPLRTEAHSEWELITLIPVSED